MDFSLNNPKIKAYLEGKSELIPAGELLYVHTHFLEHNFLSEIEVMINVAGETLAKSKNKAGVGIKLKSAAERYALLVNNVSEETAPELMACLRDIYQLCKVLM